MRKLIWAALCAAGVMGLAGQAAAAVVEIDEVSDLSQATLSGSALTLSLAAFDFSFADGDTLLFRVDFKAGQSITAPDLAQLDLQVFETPALLTHAGPPTVTYFTAGGPVVIHPPTDGAQTSGSIAQLIGTHDLAGSPSVFTGFQIESTAALTGGETTQLTSASVIVAADSFQRLGPSIPEPATWALMISGFGMTGAMLRRRRPGSLRLGTEPSRSDCRSA